MYILSDFQMCVFCITVHKVSNQNSSLISDEKIDRLNKLGLTNKPSGETNHDLRDAVKLIS